MCVTALELPPSRHVKHSPAVPLIDVDLVDKPSCLCVGLERQLVVVLCVDLCAHGLPRWIPWTVQELHEGRL